MSLSVAVVTSTLGRQTLRQTIESVRKQTRPAHHYVFAHGEECRLKVETIVEDYAYVTPVYLPCNNGGNGFAMAPVFAMAPYVIKEDVICFLDDDNFYEPDHIESLVGMIEAHNLDWAYSLRKVVDNEGEFICDDNCESLGCVPNAAGHYLVDNSCYVVKADVARRHSHAWYVPVISDRNFQAALMHAKHSTGTTGKHSVNYRISKDGSGGMTAEKFINNNEHMKQNHPHLQWAQKQLFNF